MATPTVDYDKVIQMRITQKMSYAQIGKVVGLTAMGIKKILDKTLPEAYKVDPNIITMERLREQRGDLLAIKHQSILEAITPEKIEKASLKDLAMSSKLIHEQERLEQNKSTSNSTVQWFQMVQKSQENEFDI